MNAAVVTIFSIGSGLEALGLIVGVIAISGDRRSLPSLAMVSQDLADVLADRYTSEPEADAYLDQLRALRRPA